MFLWFQTLHFSGSSSTQNLAGAEWRKRFPSCYLPYYRHVKTLSLCRAVQLYSYVTRCTVWLVSHNFFLFPSVILILQAQIMHYLNLPDVKNEIALLILWSCTLTRIRNYFLLLPFTMQALTMWVCNIPLYEEGVNFGLTGLQISNVAHTVGYDVSRCLIWTYKLSFICQAVFWDCFWQLSPFCLINDMTSF